MKLETVVDSGAAESVAPVGMAPWVPRQESEGSKRGARLTCRRAATNCRTWARKSLTWSLLKDTEPRRPSRWPLCSVSKMCDKGNRVVFELGGGYVEHINSGVRTNFTRQNNVYVMDMYVQDPGVRLEETDFGRQGK